MLWLHRRLLALRRVETALQVGTWRAIPVPDGVIGYEREADGRVIRVLLNLTHQRIRVPLDGAWIVRLATGLDREGEAITAAAVELRADEGLVLARPDRPGGVVS